jgi:hypothetical protein
MDQRPRFDAKYHVGIEQVDTEHRPPPGGFLLIRPDQ